MLFHNLAYGFAYVGSDVACGHTVFPLFGSCHLAGQAMDVDRYERGTLRQSPCDTRAMCICPTEKADDYFRKDFSRYREELRYLFEVYTDGEVETLFRLLSRLYAGIENLERRTCHEEAKKPAMEND